MEVDTNTWRYAVWKFTHALSRNTNVVISPERFKRVSKYRFWLRIVLAPIPILLVLAFVYVLAYLMGVCIIIAISLSGHRYPTKYMLPKYSANWEEMFPKYKPMQIFSREIPTFIFSLVIYSAAILAVFFRIFPTVMAMAAFTVLVTIIVATILLLILAKTKLWTSVRCWANDIIEDLRLWIHEQGQPVDFVDERRGGIQTRRTTKKAATVRASLFLNRPRATF